MKFKKIYIRIVIITSLLFGFIACEDDEFNKIEGNLGTTDPRTVTERLEENNDFSTFLSILNTVNIAGEEDLSASQFLDSNQSASNNGVTLQYMVMAPTNSALSGADFSSLSDEEMENLVSNHFVESTILDFQANLEKGYRTTLAVGPDDNNLSVFVNTDNTFQFNGISTVEGLVDISATNGMIHGIDGILYPPTVADHAGANPSFSMLSQALSITGLDETLDDSESLFTVLAPTDAAFQTFMVAVENDLGYSTLDEIPVDVLTELLTYHVIADANLRSDGIAGAQATVQGEEFTVSGTVIDDQSDVNANIIITDVQGTNGVIHAVDKVLLPDAFAQVVKSANQNLLERAEDAGYTLFVDAVELAGLTDALTTNTESLTVFVPTNDAFSGFLSTIGYTSLNDFDTTEELEELTSILLYSIVEDFLLSANLTNDMELTSMQGELLSVLLSSDDDGPIIQIVDKFATPSTIIRENVGATNGLIHVIEPILISDQAISYFGLDALPPPVFGFEIYNESPLQSGWSVVSSGWAGPDFDVASTNFVKTGFTSIRQTFAGGWSGFQLNVAGDAAGAVDITGNEVLKASFYLPEGSTGATAIRVILNDNYSAFPVVNLIEGEWVDVELPLSEFGNPTEFWQFAIQIEGDPITLYMDDIGIDPAPAQIEVYSEAPLQSGWEVVSSGWAGPDFDVASTDFVRTGLTSIRQTYAGGWSGFQLNVAGGAGGAIDISGVTTFKASFYLPEGSTGATAIRVVLNDNYGAFPVVNLVEGEWVDVEFPLSAFGDPTEFWQFAIQIEGDPITLYMDNIGFH